VSDSRSFIEIRSEGTSPSGKTLRFTVLSAENKCTLGIIQWRPGWRCYVFEPAYPTVYEWVCLRDIARFIENATIAHKEKSP